eukprot:scaffold25642_cov73-Attheya_sp.AAC.6
MDNIKNLVQELEISSEGIANGDANSMLRDTEVTEKQMEDALHKSLVALDMCFNKDGPPDGNYTMDPLSCIAFDPTSDWNVANNISTGKDQWWSRLNYEYNMPGVGYVKGDVIPIFGAHVDLHPRAPSSKLKNYGKSLVNVYIPTQIASYLVQAVKVKTEMNIAEGKEIVDLHQGLTSFLMGAPKGVDVVPCKMYQPVLADEDSEEISRYDIVKMPMDQLYKAASGGGGQSIRILGGVAFVHLGATFPCAPEEISRAGQVPKGSLIDVKFKLVSFHCLSATGEKIKRITYKTATKQEY